MFEKLSGCLDLYTNLRHTLLQVNGTSLSITCHPGILPTLPFLSPVHSGFYSGSPRKRLPLRSPMNSEFPNLRTCLTYSSSRQLLMSHAFSLPLFLVLPPSLPSLVSPCLNASQSPSLSPLPLATPEVGSPEGSFLALLPSHTPPSP